MPIPATHHAMIAPSGPVARAKLRGSEKMPAPTMEPTTIAVNAGRESFGSAWDAIAHHSEKESRLRKETNAKAHYTLPPCSERWRATPAACCDSPLTARPVCSLMPVPLDAALYSPAADPPSRHPLP